MPDNEVLISELSTKAVNPLTMFELENTTDGEPDSGKTDASALGNFFLGQGTSPLEYADLQTTAKTPIGAINELDNEIADKAGIDDSTISADSAYSSQKIISLMPTNEASGAIASFKTQLAAPLLDVTLQINAQQASGTPTPINPLPITGFTGANIPHTGANVWDEVSELGTINTSTGQKAPDTQVSRSKNNIYVKPNTRYCIPKQAGIQGFILFYDENDNPIQYVQQTGDMSVYNLSANIPYSATSATFTTPSNCKYILIRYDNTSMANLSVNYPFTDTEYHAYNPNSEITTVDWTDEAGTVYGGELDLLSGKLIVTHIEFDLGAQTYSKVNNDGRYYFRSTLVKPAQSSAYVANGICEWYRMVAQNNLVNNCISIDGFVGNPFINIIDERFAGYTPEDFADELDGVKFVTELATPVEYQLSPQQITAFVGVNNIWHDANGDTAVKFKQDIQGYIDEQIASVQALVLNG